MLSRILMVVFLVFSFSAQAAKFGERDLFEVDGRKYVRDDISVLTCAVETGGNHTTCLDANGHSEASGSGFEILAIEHETMNTTAQTFYCFLIHTSADVNNGTVPSGGEWLFGRDCSGAGTDSSKSLTIAEVAAAANKRSSYVKDINFTVPSGSKITSKMTGSNGGTMVYIYGVSLP